MTLEHSYRSRLGEDVRAVEISVNLGHLYDAGLLRQADVVPSHLNVFAALVVHWILNQLNRALVVLEDLGRVGVLAAKEGNDGAEVTDLARALRECDILTLTRTQRDDRLQATVPRDQGAVVQHNVPARRTAPHLVR
eukprot:CAMPEP_0179853228 /NCGR_PEP_ID=MMETSP0982-20121206/9241_1 /TAXON_ID=483367 /ORGANISM="non described non described, Strain CCMP 2436" /LENGTH=136 /DNA_ID=CAMNT_0021738939 /DNA_START=132 /DNA_END=539 /DNA_ORIENTATION=+